MILINPPSPFLEDDRVFPYLGIVQLATAWESRGLTVEVIDLTGNKKWKDDVAYAAEDDKIFGVTSTSPQFKYAYEINKIIKKINPKTFTIIGGPHASAISMLKERGLIDYNTKSLEEFDMIVNGDGEELEFGIRKWVNTEIIQIGKYNTDRTFIDLNSYKSIINGKPTTTIMTQRGCPFKCEFCSGRDMEMYAKPRQRGIESVISEMDELSEQGFKSFMWYDDEININSKRLQEVCRELETRDYQHRGFVRSDLIMRHPKTVEWLARAGFVELCSGVESGSNRILEVINKGTTYKINMDARRLIQSFGMKYKAFTIVGHPTETQEDTEMTKRWIQEAQPDSFDVTILTPYPGSRIYDNAQPSRQFGEYGFEYKGLYFNRPDFSRDMTFYKGTGDHPCFTRTDSLTSKDLLRIRGELLKCT